MERKPEAREQKVTPNRVSLGKVDPFGAFQDPFPPLPPQPGLCDLKYAGALGKDGARKEKSGKLALG